MHLYYSKANYKFCQEDHEMYQQNNEQLRFGENGYFDNFDFI